MTDHPSNMDPNRPIEGINEIDPIQSSTDDFWAALDATLETTDQEPPRSFGDSDARRAGKTLRPWAAPAPTAGAAQPHRPHRLARVGRQLVVPALMLAALLGLGAVLIDRTPEPDDGFAAEPTAAPVPQPSETPDDTSPTADADIQANAIQASHDETRLRNICIDAPVGRSSVDLLMGANPEAPDSTFSFPPGCGHVRLGNQHGDFELVRLAAADLPLEIGWVEGELISPERLVDPTRKVQLDLAAVGSTDACASISEEAIVTVATGSDPAWLPLGQTTPQRSIYVPDVDAGSVLLVTAFDGNCTWRGATTSFTPAPNNRTVTAAMSALPQQAQTEAFGAPMCVVDIISPDTLNVRHQPSIEGTVLHALEPNECVSRAGNDLDGWTPVVARDGTSAIFGWSSARFLRVDDGTREPAQPAANGVPQVISDPVQVPMICVDRGDGTPAEFRSEQGERGFLLATVPDGYCGLKYGGVQDGWFRIRYFQLSDGPDPTLVSNDGWIIGDDLSFAPDASGPEAATLAELIGEEPINHVIIVDCDGEPNATTCAAATWEWSPPCGEAALAMSWRASTTIFYDVEFDDGWSVSPSTRAAMVNECDATDGQPMGCVGDFCSGEEPTLQGPIAESPESGRIVCIADPDTQLTIRTEPDEAADMTSGIKGAFCRLKAIGDPDDGWQRVRIFHPAQIVNRSLATSTGWVPADQLSAVSQAPGLSAAGLRAAGYTDEAIDTMIIAECQGLVDGTIKCDIATWAWSTPPCSDTDFPMWKVGFAQSIVVQPDGTVLEPNPGLALDC